ncbi:MAG: tRNA adenosine(34) deaminase TadA [Planctomycetota bacterium]
MQQPDLLKQFDEHWMGRALELASAAVDRDEVPVGAIILHQADVIAEAANAKESLKDPTAHAEMIAITQAAASRNDWRLSGCTLYVTLEPCLMCAGAILQSRIGRVVFGAADPKAGAVTSLYKVLGDTRLNHQCVVTGGVMQQRCGNLLTQFFQAKRAAGKK